MDVFQKFIIENGSLIIAKCTYHKQLVIDKENVKGGGWWTRNSETKTFTLFGDSHDFGMASIEDIKKCIDDDLVFYNPYSDISMAGKFNFNYRDQLGNITELKNNI
jgi:hypothetical protein